MRTGLITVALVAAASTVSADALTCSLANCRAAPGLAAAVTKDVLTVTWEGTRAPRCGSASPSRAGRPPFVCRASTT